MRDGRTVGRYVQIPSDRRGEGWSGGGPPCGVEGWSGPVGLGSGVVGVGVLG